MAATAAATAAEEFALGCRYLLDVPADTPIFDSSRELRFFCERLEAILRDGLKEKSSFFGGKKGYWSYIEQWRKVLSDDGDVAVATVAKGDTRTVAGRGRAFLRYGLVDRKLAEYLGAIIEHQSILEEWYEPRAALRDPAIATAFLQHLARVCESVNFVLCERDVDLDRSWVCVHGEDEYIGSQSPPTAPTADPTAPTRAPNPRAPNPTSTPTPAPAPTPPTTTTTTTPTPTPTQPPTANTQAVLAEKDARISTLEADNHRLEEELARVRAEVQALRERQSLVEDADAEKRALVAENQTLASARDAAASECDALRGDRDALRGECDALGRERDALRAECDAAQAHASTQEGRVAELEAQTLALTEQVTAMEKANAAHRAEVETVTRERDELRESLAAKTTEAREVWASLRKTEKEMEALREGHEEVVSKLINDQGGERERVSRMREEISTLRAAQKEAAAQARTQSEEHAQALARLNEALAKAQEQARVAEAQVRASEEASEAQAQVVAEHKAALVAAQEAHASTNETQAALEEEHAQTLVKMRVMAEAMLTTKAELEEAQLQAGEAEAKMAEARQTAEAAVRDRDAFRDEAADARTDRDQYEQDFQDLSLLHHETSRKLEAAETRVVELTESVSQLVAEVANLQRQVAERGGWADDKETKNCNDCNEKFTLTRRKHHCRSCGQIFCNACSSNRVETAMSAKPVRVCDSCFEDIINTRSRVRSRP